MICRERGIAIAASEIAWAPATPRVLVSSRRYPVRRTAVTRIAGPRFREITSSRTAERVTWSLLAMAPARREHDPRLQERHGEGSTFRKEAAWGPMR
jgi:hypothetical protein